MKLAKKFMTLALATALGVGCATVGVSAAGSRTSAITVSAEQSAIYEVVQKLKQLSMNSFRNLTEKNSLQVLMNSKYLMQTKQRRMLMVNMKLRSLFQVSQILWKTFSL